MQKLRIDLVFDEENMLDDAAQEELEEVIMENFKADSVRAYEVKDEED